ncbi:MAG TPA: glycosyl hydrolase 53 family protein [Segetibacter sp.]
MRKIRPFLRLLPFLYFLSALNACSKSEGEPPVTPPVTPPPVNRVFYEWNNFAMGADLSYVNQVQDYGGVYKDSGTVKDPFVIFKNHGTNVVRVRLWHNPQWLAALNNGKIYSNLADVEKTIQRAKAAGMAVNLDFHYSDRWADPGTQITPAAWNNLSVAVLKDSVYNYTLGVLNTLKSKNLTPEMVQIGNETNQGMLFNTGKVVNNNFAVFGQLLNSGIKAVRDFSQTSVIKPQIILHVAKLTDADYFANGVIVSGVTDFDILGISHYYVYSSLTQISSVGATIRALKTKYNKKIMIVETAYPWSSQGADAYNNVISGAAGFAGYGVSAAEQYKYLKDFTQEVISAGGSGVMYWEPAWITSSLKDEWGTGSSWENNAFFDFSGNTLPGIDFMNYPYRF